AARTAVLAGEIRRERRRWLPVRAQAGALDPARQAVAGPRDSPVANKARAWGGDVGSGGHWLGVAGPQGDFVGALEVHRERILVPGQGAGACKAATDQDRESDNVSGSHHSNLNSSSRARPRSADP